MSFHPSNRKGPGGLSLRGHFIRRIHAAHAKTPNSAPTILHWSPQKKDLEVWYWPTADNGQRVPPSELESHRRSHDFRSPCCLCAAEGNHGPGLESDYVEAQIGLVTTSPNAYGEDYGRHVLNGEYVAVCAQRRCGYLVCLEWFYALPLLFVRYYNKREHPLPEEELNFICDLPEQGQSDTNDGLFQILPQSFTRGTKRKLQIASFDTLDDLPQQIETLIQDGVTESVFWSMFVQCSACKIITATAVFPHIHNCPYRQRYDASAKELVDYTRSKRRRMRILRAQNMREEAMERMPIGASDLSDVDLETEAEVAEAEIPTDIDSDVAVDQFGI